MSREDKISKRGRRKETKRLEKESKEKKGVEDKIGKKKYENKNLKKNLEWKNNLIGSSMKKKVNDVLTRDDSHNHLPDLRTLDSCNRCDPAVVI